MPEQIIDIVNPSAGVRDSPSFEPSDGGSSRMVNYVVLPDGEVVPRDGYVVADETVIHINSDGLIDSGRTQTGPLVVLQPDDLYFFRLPEGASWVSEQKKLYFTVPPQGDGFDPSGYWVDLSADTINDDAIYRWSTNTDNIGDAQRPDRDVVVPSGVHAGTAAENLSHPLIFGLTSDAPNNENPIEIVFRAGTPIINFKIRVKEDSTGSDDTFWAPYDKPGIIVNYAANTTIVFEWPGTDADYDTFGESVVGGLEAAWGWVVSLGGLLHKPSAADRQTKEISQDQFESAYLEVEYGPGPDAARRRYRYYLYSHRTSDVGAQVAGALQAGLQVGVTGAQVAGPYGAAAGAAVAVAGIAGSLYGGATEGERVRLDTNLDRPLHAGDDGDGFQIGQYVFCHTYSYDEERTIESIPSRTTELSLFSFENLKNFGRTRQRIQLNLSGIFKDALFDWAKWINVYAARTSNTDADNKIAQGLGLRFSIGCTAGTL